MPFAGGVLFTIGLKKEDAMVVKVQTIQKMESIKYAVLKTQSIQIAGLSHIFK